MGKITFFIFIVVFLFSCENSTELYSSLNDSISIQTETTDLSNTNNDYIEPDIKVTFIELGSVNCTPCKMMQSVIEKVEKKYEGQVKIIFYDVWTEEDAPMAEKYEIMIIPTQIFLDSNGVEYFRHEGYFPFEELEEILKQKGVN